MAKNIKNYHFVLNILLLIEVSSYSVDKPCNNGSSLLQLEKSSSGHRHLHEKCCPGYRQELSNESTLDFSIECVPICTPACKNGTCEAPGVCACDKGFKPYPDHENNCIPYCSDGCQHGTCISPEQCICNHGYQYDLDKELCQPVCTDPCHNGTCVSPENCECYPGYRKSETNECQPYCSVGCHNGHCIRPDYCACDPGWSHFNRHFLLSPGECFKIDVEYATDGEIAMYIDWSDDAVTSTKISDNNVMDTKNDKIKTDSDETNVFIIIGSLLFVACLILFGILVLKWTNLLDYILGKSYVIEDKGATDINME